MLAKQLSAQVYFPTYFYPSIFRILKHIHTEVFTHWLNGAAFEIRGAHFLPVCMWPLMPVSLLSSALENFLLLWRGFYISCGTQFWKCFLTLMLMKCGLLELSRYVAGKNVIAFHHYDFCLVCTEFWNRCTCELHNWISCCEPWSFQALVRYYQNRPWCDKVKPSFATHMVFCLPLLFGFQTWNETRLVKDCSFTTCLFIGVLAVIHFLGPRLTFCVIAAACSATSSSGFCFLNFQPEYTFWSSVM